MKNTPMLVKAFTLFFVCLFLNNFSAFAQKSLVTKTTIWFVREAEKEAATPQTLSDPNLSADGIKRSEALSKLLRREKIKAIYINKYKSAAQTARPLAAKLKLIPRIYGDSLKTFAASVLKEFWGDKLVIIGSASKLMPLLAAFGSELPFEQLDEDDYDMVFKVTIQDWAARELEVSYYGTLHHKSDLPQKYKEDGRPSQQFAIPPSHY